MTRSTKTPPMGFLSKGSQKRLQRRLGGKLKQKADKTVSAGFVMSIDFEFHGIESTEPRKRVPFSRRMRVEAETETAINSIQKALTEVESVASQILPKTEQYPGLTALTSDDMWFGNPKDMPEEDLAFFGLEK
jgi:hypothetical protein